jgi:hypothetical protein
VAKKQTPQQMLAEQCQEVNRTVASWKSHKENGCNDPFWPDGVNMNLLRNHLRWHKSEIFRICNEHNLPLPQEAYTPNLPYTDSNFFAKPDSERAKRIMSSPGWKCGNSEKSSGEYDDTALTLF